MAVKTKATVSVNGGPELDMDTREAQEAMQGVAARAMGKRAEPPSLPMDAPEMVDKATASRLKSIIERVERLEEERSAISEDIKEVYGEAKATGFDTKILRHIVKLRKVDPDKQRESEMLLEIYKAAIGME